MLIKRVPIQHLFGIPSLRQTHREIQVNVAYRWFLGYGLPEDISHFAAVSYAFCKRFPDGLTGEIFEHILNKALLFRLLFLPVSPIFEENPCSRFLKAGVL